MPDRTRPDRAEVVRHIRETRRRLRRQFAQQESHPLLHLNVTMSQLKVLVLLAETEGASSQDLARSTHVGLATMSGIVDRLVAQQLVSRREDPRDRRVRRLELTPSGRELIDTVMAAGEQAQERLFHQLDLPALEVVAHAFDLILRAAVADAETTHGQAPPDPTPAAAANQPGQRSAPTPKRSR